jgi:hypothetical protein
MYYSGSMDNNMFGIGFLVNKKCKFEVIGFEQVNEAFSVLNAKSRLKNTGIVHALAPTEKEDISKHSF